MPQSTRSAVLAFVLTAVLAGCRTAPESTTTPTASFTAASAAAASAAAADDRPGAITCAKLAAAVEAGSLMDPGVVDGVVAASGTADAPVADAAQRLATAYAVAVAAKGGEDEPDAVAAVSAAAADMAGVCADSGLRTVG